MKEPVALLVNDLHVSKDNIDEFKKNWNEALNLCDNLNIGYLIIGGDMFTERSSQSLSTLLAVRGALDEAVRHGISVVIAEGNHDKIDQEQFEGYNHLWRGIKDINVIDTYEIIQWTDDFCLIIISYFPENGLFLKWLDEAIDKAVANSVERANIVLYIHEGVHGALGEFEIEGELPQEPLLGFKAVLCGHYHNRVKIKGTNIEYIGASRQHNFGEDEEKGYTILYNDGTYKFIKNQANTRFKTLELDYDEIADYQLPPDDRYRFKVKVKCNDAQIKIFDRQQLLDMGFHKVELLTDSPQVKEIDGIGIDEKYDAQGIRKEYQSYCSEREIDSELGLKYL